MSLPEWLTRPRSKVYTTHRDKVPTIKINDLSNFISYEDAKEQIHQDPQLGLGVGMWGYLCGIDIDGCIDNNVISDEAQAIIDLFPEAYIEKSFSGTGLHFLFLCQMQVPDRKDSYYIKMGKKHMSEKSLPFKGLEFYQGLYDHRYLTLTENSIQSPPSLTYVSGEKLLAFLDQYFKRPQPSSTNITTISTDPEDEAWWRWAKKRLRQGKAQRLYDLASKTPTGSGGTESEDDLALMSEIAFWCNKNPDLMREVFETSYYYKHKDQKHKNKWARLDYSQGVIDRAIQSGSVAKVYFEDSFEYDPNTNEIVPIKTEGGDAMIAPKHTTRISQSGKRVHILETKRFKFEVSDPQQKKDSTERYVQWVSVYKKGSDEPADFLERTDPAFELAAGIILEKEEQ